MTSMLVLPEEFDYESSDAYFHKENKSFIVMGEYEGERAAMILFPPYYEGGVRFKVGDSEDKVTNKQVMSYLGSDYYCLIFLYNEEPLMKNIKEKEYKKLTYFKFVENEFFRFNQIIYRTQKNGPLKSFQNYDLRYGNVVSHTPRENQRINKISVFQGCLTVESELISEEKSSSEKTDSKAEKEKASK